MDDALRQIFLDTVLPIAGTALSMLTTWAMYQLTGWLKGKVHDATFHCAMDKLTTVTEAAVLEASQTTVRTIKAAGHWDKGMAIEIRKDVEATVRRHLGSRGWAEVRSCLGKTDEDVAALVRTMIEAQLARLKQAAPPKRMVLNLGATAAKPANEPPATE